MDILRFYNLLQQVGGQIRAELRASAKRYGLALIQLETLHYLSQCNRYSNTPIAVTEFLGTTKGRGSQTLSILENKSLIQKTQDTKDARLLHCKLTEEGERIVRATLPPANLFGLANRELEQASEESVALLSKLLHALQLQSRHHLFGFCRTCVHFMRNPTGFSCHLMEEELSFEETQKLCIKFRPLR